MENKNLKNEYKNVLNVGLPFLVILVILFIYFENKLEKCYRISICRVIGFESDFEGGSSPLFAYEYNSVMYKNGGAGDMSNINQLNSRYFIKVSCGNPKIVKIIRDVHVPDTLKFIPTNGWVEIPYGLDNVSMK
ncbi:hypothetical protein [Lacihabitans lacunae]|uniref:Uncharacterized protein n=1 Tax=Lacihabitans lacunae TaxID=1028214 RepID=A0ABV7Z326_9BACT